MKITDPHIIQTGEKKLITAVQEKLDQETVKTILKERLSETSVASRGGQIVVHDNNIAFRLDFDLKLSGSLLFDRQGNYISTGSKSSAFSNEKKSSDGTNRASESLEHGLDALDDVAMAENLDLGSDDIQDHDLNSILQESREFREQKKGS